MKNAERILELRARSRAYQGHDILAARHDPGDSELCRRRVQLIRERRQSVGQRQVLLQVLALPAWRMGAKIASVESTLPGPTQKAARQNAVGGDADAEF